MAMRDSIVRSFPDWSREAALMATGARAVAGVDEAGRGPLAGPVVVAAVIFEAGRVPAGLDDSKRLPQVRREVLYEEIRLVGQIGVAIADVERIDRDNILRASLWAMTEAVTALATPPCAALIDGNQLPALRCDAHAIIGGDGISASIAAASIVAKVTRDRMMEALDAEFPGYGWMTNRGYGTVEHLTALARLGPTPHHRRSFRPVREAMATALGA